MCFRQSADADSNASVPVSEALLEVMKQNQGVAQWQYVGLQSGTFAKYPSNRDDLACGSYDPRLR